MAQQDEFLAGFLLEGPRRDLRLEIPKGPFSNIIEHVGMFQRTNGVNGHATDRHSVMLATGVYLQ